MSTTPDGLLAAYVRAFETKNPDVVVPFYHLPCTFIAPQSLVVVQDAASARGLVAHLLEQAQSQAYRRTEIRDVKTRRLAASLASFSGVFVRYNTAEEEIARFGFTYIVRFEAGAWKIAVAIAHDVSPSEA